MIINVLDSIVENEESKIGIVYAKFLSPSLIPVTFVISSCSFHLLPWGSERKTTKLFACMLLVFTEAKRSAKSKK